MVQVLIILIALFFTFIIFYYRKSYVSLLWAIGGMLLLNSDIYVINYPLHMGIWRWLTFSLLFAAFYQIGRLKREFNTFPLKKVLKLISLAILLIAVTDSRLSIFNRFYIPFKEIFEKFFLLFIGYFFIRNKEDLHKIAKPIFVILLIISIYGAFNYIAKINPYFKFVSENFFSKITQSDAHLNSKLIILNPKQFRFRAVSTFNHTFNYGYASSLLALYIFTMFNIVSKKHGFLTKIAFLFGLTGAVLCFSRIVLLAVLLSFFVLIYFSTGFSKKIIISTAILFVGFLSYLIFSPFQKAIDNTFDIFITGGELAGGSSINMRIVQLFGAFRYFMQNPILGNGFEYINKELGWAERDRLLLDPDMYGFESIIYQLMIEQGILGLLYHLILLIALVAFFIRFLKKEKAYASLGLSIVSLFFIFSVGTGPLKAWPLTLLFLGMIMKYLVLSKSDKTAINSDVQNSSKKHFNLGIN